MGQILKRKRRGRPSNIDRARRNSSVAPPSPVDRRRSCRRRNVRYSFDIDDYVDDDEFSDEEAGRRKKKLKLLLREDGSRWERRVRHAPASLSSDDYDEDDDDDDDGNGLKKRRLGRVDGENDEDDEIEQIRERKLEEDDDEETGGSDFVSGTVSDLSKEVPLPDNKTLYFILDKLQKKDIYGVYAEPVDPEELPDYHDVIKHPMDFGTVRKKVAKGMYLTLKEFENDVLLICTNAMQYNAPDTIYYKQASSIQDQAKLKFQRLRANGDRSEIQLKPEQKTTSFLPPSKQLKKLVTQATQDPVGLETFSGSCVRTDEFTNTQIPATRPSSVENSSLAENHVDKEQEPLPGMGFISKLGKKPSVREENRRATYDISVQPVTEPSSIFSIFEGESKQFIPVGLHSEYSYARSLARFAATLGPVAWQVASQTIEQVLPEDVKFGCGWVGEYEPLPSPVNCALKEADFLAHFKITSGVRNDEISCRNTTPGNDKVAKTPLDGKRLNDGQCDSQKFPVVTKDHIAKIPQPPKDMKPPFFYSSQVNPVFAGYQNAQSRKFTRPEKEGSQKVGLNHPPSTHASAADFVATRPISHVSDTPSPNNGNLVSLPSFKHLNSNNDGFVSGRPPTPVGLGCHRMVPMENHLPHQREKQGLSDPVQMMKMLAQHQQNNSHGFCSAFPTGPKREDSNNSAATIPQLPTKVHHQQMYSIDSQIGSKRDDSSNVALTSAQAWMSLGAAEFIKPVLAVTSNPHIKQISVDSLYNPAQVSRELPVPGIHFQRDKKYQQPVHAFVPEAVRMLNEARSENRHVGFPQLVAADLSRFQVQSGSSWRGVTPQLQQQSRVKQPDLNVGYQSMGSTGMLADSLHPDLALQL